MPPPWVHLPTPLPEARLVRPPLSTGDGATGEVLRKAGTTCPSTRKSSAGTSSAAAKSVPARNQFGTTQGCGYTDFVSRKKL
eukprot:193939-Amphidinium_carterae.1